MQQAATAQRNHRSRTEATRTAARRRHQATQTQHASSHRHCAQCAQPQPTRAGAGARTSTSRRPRCATRAARVAKGRLTRARVGQQPGNQPRKKGNRSRTRKSSWCREFHAVAPKLDRGKHSPASPTSNACATRSMGHEEQPKQPNKQLSAAIALCEEIAWELPCMQRAKQEGENTLSTSNG